jgi:signal transduction histidine kinase
MNWHAVPVAIMAGITGYAAIIFVGLYFVLAKDVEKSARREYLSFAIFCMAGVLWDVTCIGLYNSRSSAQGITWQRYQLLMVAVLGVSYTDFLWHFIKMQMPLYLTGACVTLTILGLVGSVMESTYGLTQARPMNKHIQTLGLDVIYYEGDPGVIVQALMVLFLIVYFVNTKHMLRYFLAPARRDQRGKYGIIMAVMVMGIAAINDASVAAGFHRFLYMSEYGMAAVWMALGYVLIMKFGELQETVNGLNSDLSKTNADLKVAVKQAQESVRAKTEFLASISHDLRTPLNAIINMPEGLLSQIGSYTVFVCRACGAEFEPEEGEVVNEGVPCAACGAAGLSEDRRQFFNADIPKAYACIQTVAKAGRRLLGLVDNILDASKLELGQTVVATSSFDPRALVREVIDSTRGLADKRDVSVRLQDPSEREPVTTIIADRVKVAQVLYNLIGNAIKFSPERGEIEVSIDLPTPSEIVFCVRDQGFGIAPEHQDSVFEKFRQVDSGATRAYEGTGLELAISKGLVELHGGQIWVESSPGSGSAFFVRLPSVPQT